MTTGRNLCPYEHMSKAPSNDVHECFQAQFGMPAHDQQYELNTSRLHLRMFLETDWGPLCSIFSDPECVRYTRGKPEADWETWRRLASYLGHWSLRGYGPYAVVEKSSKLLIGVAGLWYPGDWTEPEIQWSLMQAAWGQGFATEAATAIKSMAAQQLKWTRLMSLLKL